MENCAALDRQTRDDYQEFPHILRATSGKRFQINRLPEM